MIEVTYLLEDGSNDWTYSVKKLRTSVECIREDIKEEVSNMYHVTK